MEPGSEHRHPDDGMGRGTGGLTPEIYTRLRAIAASYLRRERKGHTLQPTALVNEAFVRLGGASETGFNDRRHFVAAVARAMRNILVDHARARNAAKRGGSGGRAGAGSGLPLEIEAAGVGGGRASGEEPVDLLMLDEALEKLEALDERQARVVELRFFGGMTVAETASLLGVSDRTVELDWGVARAWLRRALREDADG